jgi:WYL domain
MYATIRLPLQLQDAQQIVPPHRGHHETDGSSTLVTIGGTDPNQLANYVFGLSVPLEIISPASVREAVRERAAAALLDSRTTEATASTRSDRL